MLTTGVLDYENEKEEIEMSYKNRVLEWVRNETSRNAEYVPEDFPLHSFYSKNMSDDALEYLAIELETKMRNKKKEGRKNEYSSEVFLVPYIGENGVTYFVDKSRPGYNLKAMLMPMGNGLFSFKGDPKYMEILGGRGVFSGLETKMERSMKYFDTDGK
ncbi:MAG TPA: hypothetical protein VJB11_02155 [archaeon]|nr:hypothetical protein [archaeon]